MTLSELAPRILGIGREVNPDTALATRELMSPHALQLDPDEVRVERDVSYGPDERNRCDIFTPASGFKADRPLLVYVHGGGFVAGDKHAEGSPFFSNIGQWAVSHGCNAVAMTYRLAPVHQWPSGVEDLHALVNFLRRSGPRHGVSADRIFLMGQSAGAAHVASYIAHPDLYAPDPHGIRGLILLSGVYNFETMETSPLEKAYLGDDPGVYGERSSLEGLLDSKLPLLLSLAENDPGKFEQQGLELMTAWQQRHGQLPSFVYAIGQNHISVAMALGIDGDPLAPQLRDFIARHSDV